MTTPHCCFSTLDTVIEAAATANPPNMVLPAYLVLIWHLIELIHAADTPVCQYNCASLKHGVSSHCIPHN
jgi:hypothetical protein